MIHSKKIILSLPIVFLSLFTFVFLVVAKPMDATNEIADIRISVDVLDIYPKQKTAEVKIRVFIPNFPYNETKVRVYIAGGGFAIVLCENTEEKVEASEWFFQGESNLTTWLLEGIGETFPFDSYLLRFKVTDLQYANFSLLSGDHQASFDGPKAYMLRDIWRADDARIPTQYTKVNEVGFVVEKNWDARLLTGVQLLAPVVVCYYLLGATLMLDPKKDLNGRLRIYLSLFVFASTFLIAVQPLLPYHSSLTFPEFLLTNLTISTAILGIGSIVGYSKKSERTSCSEKQMAPQFFNIWDAIASIISLALFIVLFYVSLFGKMNIVASFFFSYGILPSYIYGPFLIARREDLIKGKKTLAVVFVLFLIPALLYILIRFISIIV